jgi:hypothetical protein
MLKYNKGYEIVKENIVGQTAFVCGFLQLNFFDSVVTN